MRPLIIIICCLIVFSDCNPCDKYKDEIYKVETFQSRFDSTGLESMKTFLKIYNEPEMNTLDHESYRLFFGHVFSDTIHIIRIGNSNSNYYFMHKKLIRDSDTTAVVVENIEKNLPISEWKIFKKSIYRNEYWMLPREIDKEGLDGGTWTIEGRRPDAEICKKRIYHIVSRWSPEEGKFRKICEKLIEIDEEKVSSE